MTRRRCVSPQQWASRIAQLSLVDCLFVGVAQRSYDETMTALELTYAAVHRRRRGR